MSSHHVTRSHARAFARQGVDANDRVDVERVVVIGVVMHRHRDGDDDDDDDDDDASRRSSHGRVFHAVRAIIQCDADE